MPVLQSSEGGVVVSGGVVVLGGLRRSCLSLGVGEDSGPEDLAWAGLGARNKGV